MMVPRKVSKIREAVRWLASHELAVLLAVLVVVAGTWGFAVLAEEVLKGRSQSFDEWAVRCLRQQENSAALIGPVWLTEAARDVTALGGASVLVCINLAVAGGFVAKRKFKTLAFVMAAVVGGLVLWLALRACIARPRPEIVPHLCAVYGSSFPSGHSMMSAVVYLMLGAVLAARTARRRFKLGVLLLALLLAGLVGVSRVCLGVHYPTDVLAGWTAGLVWAAFCWLLARKMRPRIPTGPENRPFLAGGSVISCRPIFRVKKRQKGFSHMFSLFRFLFVVLLCVVGVGLYRGWFSFSSAGRDPQDQHVDIRVSVDTNKLGSDAAKVKQRLAAEAEILAQRAKERDEQAKMRPQKSP